MEQALRATGASVEIATTDDDGRDRHNGKPLGVVVHEGGGARRYFRKRIEFYKVCPAFALWARKRVTDYDIIHIHALFSFTSVVAAWAARRAGVPYVLRPLGTLTSYGITQRRPWLKRLSLALLEGPALKAAAAVHFTSDVEWKEATDCRVPMRGVVVPLGIEHAQASDPAVVLRRFPELIGFRYIIFLSRLDPKKNLEGLLHAFKECRDALPDVKLLVAGSGDPQYERSVRALSEKLGLVGSVVWAGHVAGELKASALAGAEIFALPSYSENFGIAAAEALMAGLPCLLGEGVAIAGDVVAAGAGVAVQPEARSIAEGLVKLLTGHALREEMSAKARALAQDKFSVGTMSGRLMQLYEMLLLGERPALRLEAP